MRKILLILFLFGCFLCKAQTVSVLKDTVVFVSSSELAINNTTPKIIIPAPGANKYIVVLKAAITSDFNTTAFNTQTNNATFLMYGTSSQDAPLVTNYFNLLYISNNVDRLFIPSLKAQVTSSKLLMINQPVVLRTRFGITQIGDLTAKVHCLYKIYTKNP